jgi:hypothetical protein
LCHILHLHHGDDLIREFQPGDLEQIQRIHAAKGYEFALPNLATFSSTQNRDVCSEDSRGKWPIGDFQFRSAHCCQCGPTSFWVEILVWGQRTSATRLCFSGGIRCRARHSFCTACFLDFGSEPLPS